MKTLIRFSNKQKNPPLNMGKKKIWTLLLLCFKCCRKKQEQCITWSVRSTYSFTSFGRSFPQELLQPDLFGLGWRKARPLTRTPAWTFSTTMEEERTNHRAAAATFHFYRLSLRQPPITDGGGAALLTRLTLKTADMAARLENNNLQGI